MVGGHVSGAVGLQWCLWSSVHRVAKPLAGGVSPEPLLLPCACCVLCERIPLFLVQCGRFMGKPLSSLGNLLTDNIEDDSYKSNDA